VYAPDLWEPKPRYRTKGRDEHLRENCNVDPAMLAEDLGVTEGFVRMYQRKLGLRKCLNPRDGGN
jgi:hypothetical protein